MFTNHIDEHIQTYVDNRLPPDTKQQVEIHLKQCPTCTQALSQANRLHQELGPVMQSALGQPMLPSRLRYQVKQRIESGAAHHLPLWRTGQLLNGLGTIAVVAVLAFSAYTVIQGKIPGLTAPKQMALSPSHGGGDQGTAQPDPSPTPTAETMPPLPHPAQQSTGDTLPATAALEALPPAVVAPPMLPPSATPETETAQIAPNEPSSPGGTIAFPLFDGQMYRIHLTNAQGEDLGQMPLPGISEPALHPAANDFALAYRSWNDPTGPRALVASNFEADRPQAVTHFWEDAQPDWSPTENRLIFASQRESDRHWRLYTAWGDGSLEVNLRREGQSPTFAPDGYRFAYQGCANNQCGLWLADLEHSELETELILANPQAKAPDWSPVGEDIAYMAESNGQWDLYLIGSDGRNLRRLTNNSANDGLPAWSPDGEWLAFVSDRDGQWGLWRLHVASGEVQPVVAFTGSLAPENRRPYNEHGERNWWDEQISWGQ